MGKLRNYNAYISISCSGPENSSIAVSRVGKIRSRSGADLRFTTADADCLYNHFKSPNYDTRPNDVHIRLVNPRVGEFLDTIVTVSNALDNFKTQENWAGGCIHIIYAGHGRDGDGALVFKDGIVLGANLAEHIATHTSCSEHRRRIDIVLDSCHSAAFQAEVVAKAINDCKDSIFPCSLFAACLHDELAWEYPRHGHGIWTASFLQQIRSPSPAQPRWILLLKLLWRRYRKLEQQKLYGGGVAFMTDNKQHSMTYENGMFEVNGYGSFELPDTSAVNTSEIFSLLNKARSQRA